MNDDFYETRSSTTGYISGWQGFDYARGKSFARVSVVYLYF